MFWIILFLIVIIVIAVAVAGSSIKASGGSAASKTRYVVRNGKPQQADTVFDAWTSGDLSAMLSQLNHKTTLVDRHFLLMSIVTATYKQRDNPEMRAMCQRIAHMHIEEFPRIRPALKRSLGVLPRVPTFQQYATILAEDYQFEDAIAVCRTALDLGLSDGTQSGFEGRIERIKKKQKKAQKKKNS